MRAISPSRRWGPQPVPTLGEAGEGPPPPPLLSSTLIPLVPPSTLPASEYERNWVIISCSCPWGLWRICLINQQKKLCVLGSDVLGDELRCLLYRRVQPRRDIRFPLSSSPNLQIRGNGLPLGNDRKLHFSSLESFALWYHREWVVWDTVGGGRDLQPPRSVKFRSLHPWCF